MQNYKNTYTGTQQITEISQFVRMIEKLISRAKLDRTESIKIEAQTTLRKIIRDLSNNKNDLVQLLEALGDKNVNELKKIVDFEKAL